MYCQEKNIFIQLRLLTVEVFDGFVFDTLLRIKSNLKAIKWRRIAKCNEVLLIDIVL